MHEAVAEQRITFGSPQGPASIYHLSLSTAQKQQDLGFRSGPIPISEAAILRLYSISYYRGDHDMYLGACVLQVCGVHSCAKCHWARLCFLQVLFHLHKAQFQVNPPTLFLFALLVYFLQLLLHISHQAAICRGKPKSIHAPNLLGLGWLVCVTGDSHDFMREE
uniref:Uncharacterized protein n=1 Tax=Gopherus evgoodei TaxID=1825980 RepID=A0A8C4YFK1_9SAUR